MGERIVKLFECARCKSITPAYLAFGVGRVEKQKTYCLNHIPRWVRFKMWLKDGFYR